MASVILVVGVFKVSHSRRSSSSILTQFAQFVCRVFFFFNIFCSSLVLGKYQAHLPVRGCFCAGAGHLDLAGRVPAGGRQGLGRDGVHQRERRAAVV